MNDNINTTYISTFANLLILTPEFPNQKTTEKYLVVKRARYCMSREVSLISHRRREKGRWQEIMNSQTSQFNKFYEDTHIPWCAVIFNTAREKQMKSSRAEFLELPIFFKSEDVHHSV